MSTLSFFPSMFSGPRPDAASPGPEWRGEDHLATVIASLDGQIEAALQQIGSLQVMESTSADAATALEAINLSFNALRRARALIAVLDDPVPFVH